jgi:3-oxoadipate CoA-transferase, alpha subunit
MDKRVYSMADALHGIRSGSTILVSGFGEVGAPTNLLDGLLDLAITDLTIVANNAGVGDGGIGALLRERRVSKIICSYPRSSGSVWFERRYSAGEVALELVPQGTLSERIRAGGAGIGGFYTATGVGTTLTAGKPTREVRGRRYVLEDPIRADVALIRAHLADRWGNLSYRAAARNYGPVMATAADLTIVQVAQVVGLGEIPPEAVVTPGIYVDRVLQVPSDPAADRWQVTASE